jgi:hypothetical protein
MLNVAVAKISLQSAGIVPLVGERVAASVPKLCGCALKPSLASTPTRSIIRAKPAVVNGDPRFEVNTNGDFGSCSRCKRRSARISSPKIGCVLGVPCLTRRTCSVPVLKST